LERIAAPRRMSSPFIFPSQKQAICRVFQP
jgi:hypothetical protein